MSQKTINLPNWAYQNAGTEDWPAVKKFRQHIKIDIAFSDKALKRWMDYNGWKRSWFTLKDSFLEALLSDEKNFKLALDEGVLKIQIPKEVHILTDQDLQEYDRAYTDREWESMVLGLREFRRLIEAGVILDIGGEKFTSVSTYLSWVHARYHLLEEGTDRWVGSDY